MTNKNVIGTKDVAMWIDLINPTAQDLELIAAEYQLDPPIVADCLDPEHLPKYEQLSNGDFFILRTFDLHCSKESDTAQELTRKIAIFKTHKVLITIHRSPLQLLETITHHWQSKKLKEDDLKTIVFDIIDNVFKSYDKPIDTLLDQLEQLEMSIFGAQGAKPFDLIEGYLLKRKSFVFKRLLRSMTDIFTKLSLHKNQSQILKEASESLLFYCEEITESTNSLLNLHISLSQQKTNEAAHQTNEVIRVLTIFSMFLLPLNVVTGIYGMNFDFMPELKWPHGYFFALGLMASIMITIYLWFKSKGWLKLQ